MWLRSRKISLQNLITIILGKIIRRVRNNEITILKKINITKINKSFK